MLSDQIRQRLLKRDRGTTESAPALRAATSASVFTCEPNARIGSRRVAGDDFSRYPPPPRDLLVVQVEDQQRRLPA
jgi:hypothetical protein